MLFSINDKDSRPIYLQIANQVKEQVHRGQIKPGDELPSVRELANSLGINLHTVRSAYQKLREQGIINLRLGQRARIARLRRPPVNNAEAEAALSGRIKEMITDAFLLGITAEQFKDIVGRHLDEPEDDNGENASGL